MPRVKLRTGELRAHVLDVAKGMLEREGANAFTTRRIAEAAGTSMPAIYELFGDKSGLVRELFFEGFRMLRATFEALPKTADARADIETMMGTYRVFVRENPVLADLMFSQPFADFDPGPDELDAGNSVRKLIVGRVRRGIEAGAIAGDATDIAHVLLGLARGMAAQESAGWLGTSEASVDRRWSLAIRAALDGLRP